MEGRGVEGGGWKEGGGVEGGGWWVVDRRSKVKGWRGDGWCVGGDRGEWRVVSGGWKVEGEAGRFYKGWRVEGGGGRAQAG